MPSKKKEKVVHTKLYDILGASPEASEKDITKAFRLRALKLHPDKRPDVPSANEDFQALQAAYDILKDPTKRSLYNETGAEDDDDRFLQAAEHFYNSSLFKSVTEEDIECFAATYKGSKEEKEDIAHFYSRFQGDVALLLEYIPLSEPDDVERFISVMEEMIKQQVIESTPRFKPACERLRKEAQKYKTRLEKEAKHVGAGKREKSESLVEAVKANQRRREHQSMVFLDRLEAKYTKPLTKKRKRELESDSASQ